MPLSQRKLTRQDEHAQEDSNASSNSQTAAEVTSSTVKLKTPSSTNFPRLRAIFATIIVLFIGLICGLSFSPTSMKTTLQNRFDATVMQVPGVSLPEGFEFEWDRFQSSIPEIWKFYNDGREFEVGEKIKARGLDAKYPVILIPGIISTNLVSWSTKPDYKGFFQDRIWGGLNMLSQVTFSKEQWIASMMLDPVTGLDPPDVKVRAAEGTDAASSFMQGYWIWSKIIENLAVVNYDTNNLYLAPYDWRLSYYNLEERDGYFSKLKSTIESLTKRQKRKAVIAAHSMGSTYFFKWVESPEHGRGGPTWVEDHIEAFISIAGTHLGVTKSMAALLSGEMKDTVQMHPAGAYVLEHFFSRKERRKLFRSWAGSASMWLKGGDAIWGNSTHAPDDAQNATHTYGNLIKFRNASHIDAAGFKGGSFNLTSSEVGAWILEHTPVSFQKMIFTNYSFGIERDEEALARNDLDHTKWSNPLEIRLPYAPSMKIYCVYGHGKETERSYWYSEGANETDVSALAENAESECQASPGSSCRPASSPLNPPITKQTWIDSTYSNDTIYPKVLNGVTIGEGDGTVSLLSLGGMCVEGWKRPRWNPAGIKVITVELPHRPVARMPRGGANTSDHVDILGSTGLNEIILKVATGAAHEIENAFVSNIREYAQKIHWD